MEGVRGCSTHPTQKWLKYIHISTVYSSACSFGEILVKLWEVGGCREVIYKMFQHSPDTDIVGVVYLVSSTGSRSELSILTDQYYRCIQPVVCGGTLP